MTEIGPKILCASEFEIWKSKITVLPDQQEKIINMSDFNRTFREDEESHFTYMNMRDSSPSIPSRQRSHYKTENPEKTNKEEKQTEKINKGAKTAEKINKTRKTSEKQEKYEKSEKGETYTSTFQGSSQKLKFLEPSTTLKPPPPSADLSFPLMSPDMILSPRSYDHHVNSKSTTKAPSPLQPFHLSGLTTVDSIKQTEYVPRRAAQKEEEPALEDDTSTIKSTASTAPMIMLCQNYSKYCYW